MSAHDYGALQRGEEKGGSVTDTPLTPEQLQRATSFLFGAADAAEKTGQTVIVIPTRTAQALARALLAVLNA